MPDLTVLFGEEEDDSVARSLVADTPAVVQVCGIASCSFWERFARAYVSHLLDNGYGELHIVRLACDRMLKAMVTPARGEASVSIA